VINLVDISAVKASEEKLGFAHAYTNALIGSIHEPLVVLDRESRIEAASASFYALFGGRPTDSFGRPLLSSHAHQLDTPRALVPGSRRESYRAR